MNKAKEQINPVKLKPINCPICNNWSKKRVSLFEKHLQSEHQTTTKELWCKLNNGPIFCRCGCGTETKFVNWWIGYSTFLVGHCSNIYKAFSPEKAAEITRKRKEKLTGRVGWCKGLTAENDPRIAERAKGTAKGRKTAFDEGRITIWSKGKTKETDHRVAQFAIEQKDRFARGESIPWMKGGTKETDPRIAAMALNVSITHKMKEIRERLDRLKRLSPEEIKKKIAQNGRLEIIETIGEFINHNVPNIIVQCRVCGTRRQDSLQKLQHGRCFQCDPQGSADQQQVATYLLSLGITHETNNRKIIPPHELDIWVPSKNFAIEYNGLYWHNELRKSNTYHENKTLECRSKDLRLLHIFEDEWNEKREIVKSLISHRLGVTERKIGARKCSITQLTKQQRYEFFEENHIDGDTVIDAIGWGLMFEGELVAAINIRKPFHKKSQSNFLELARFCTAKHTSVPGGLARLTKVALQYAQNQGYDGLMTYVDTRLGTGKGYEAVGFKYKRRTPPRFWWYHERTKSRFNRFKYRASKSEGLSEAEVAAEAGVVKIWGCSNLVYELVIN
jgi:hypothetical protein